MSVRRLIVQLVLPALLLTSCTAEVVVNNDGRLVYNGDYPLTLPANQAFGVFKRQGACLLFIREDGATFLPIFARGPDGKVVGPPSSTLISGDRFTIEGFETESALVESVANQTATQTCAARPMFFGTITAGGPKDHPPEPDKPGSPI